MENCTNKNRGVWAFTFGSGHRHPDGSSLGNRYLRIEADSWGDARERVFESYGEKWAFQYGWEAFQKQIPEYGLTEVKLEEL